MAVVLGLGVAIAYGAADFLGGLASRRLPTTFVVLTSQCWSVVILVAVLPFLPPAAPTAADLLLGGAAGTVGVVGLMCLYAGLATGRMSVVAPVTAVGAAVVPVTFGLASGERPADIALIGIALALVAVALVAHEAAEPDSQPSRRPLALGVIAGIAFGFAFVCLAGTGDDAGAWPLLTVRMASLALLVPLTFARGEVSVPMRADLPIVVGTGTLDMAANALYLAATNLGLLSLVAVISALYPAATVVLARVVLHERLRRVQSAGRALAATGVVLIAAG